MFGLRELSAEESGGGEVDGLGCFGSSGNLFFFSEHQSELVFIGEEFDSFAGSKSGVINGISGQVFG